MPKNIGHFLTSILIFAHDRAKTSYHAIQVERAACCHVSNAFLGRLELIQAENVQKMHFCRKAPGVNRVI